MSKLTDYGILLLTCFAKSQNASVLNARDLAVASHLPLPTVGKLLKLLSRGELLGSHRGVNGGYQLTKKPHEISIAHVISLLEGPVSLTECGGEDSAGVCEIEGICPVKGHWQKINHVVVKALEDLTLADMVSLLPLYDPVMGGKK